MRYSAISALALGTLLLAACGSDDDGGSSTSTGGSAGAATGGTTAGGTGGTTAGGTGGTTAGGTGGTAVGGSAGSSGGSAGSSGGSAGSSGGSAGADAGDASSDASDGATGTDASCGSNQVPTVAGCLSCSDAIGKVNDGQKAAKEANDSCINDTDCVVAGTGTTCQGGCPTAVSQSGLSAYNAALSKLSADYCSGYVPVCGYMTPSCLAGAAKCISGSCAYSTQ